MVRSPLIGYGAFRMRRSLSPAVGGSTWMIPFLNDVGTRENPAAVAGRLGGIDAQGERPDAVNMGPCPMTAGYVRQMPASKLDVTLSTNVSIF